MSFLRPLSIPTGSWVQVTDTPMIIHRYVSDKVVLFIPSHTHHVRCADRDRVTPAASRHETLSTNLAITSRQHLPRRILSTRSHQVNGTR